jgi:hypothetical protein
MTLPKLYAEVLIQQAGRGSEHLNVYKLGMIEAILKEAGADEGHPDLLRSAIRTALEVARWEPPGGTSRRNPPTR